MKTFIKSWLQFGLLSNIICLMISPSIVKLIYMFERPESIYSFIFYVVRKLIWELKWISCVHFNMSMRCRILPIERVKIVNYLFKDYWQVKGKTHKMDYMLFASVINSISWQKSYITTLNIENQATILRGDWKRADTGIPLHENGLPSKVPKGKLLAIDQLS